MENLPPSTKLQAPPPENGVGWSVSASRTLVFLAKAALTILLAFVPIIPAYAQKPSASEVEAAYLYNFAKYVRWPPHKPAEFDICILGTDPFGNALDQIAHGEKIDGESLVIRRLHLPSEALGCRILFLGSSESKRLEQDMSQLGTHPILTVSDIDNFARQGGTIQFVDDNGRVRFIINRGGAEKCGLALSSELLKVAKLVLPDSAPGRE